MHAGRLPHPSVCPSSSHWSAPQILLTPTSPLSAHLCLLTRACPFAPCALRRYAVGYAFAYGDCGGNAFIGKPKLRQKLSPSCAWQAECPSFALISCRCPLLLLCACTKRPKHTTEPQLSRLGALLAA